MIDVVLCLYDNYRLAERCIAHNLSIDPELRLVVMDNTPPERKADNFLSTIESDRVRVVEGLKGGSDGESHGASLDLLFSLCETDIVGSIDHDFFWLRPNISSFILRRFYEGYEAIGCAGWYPLHNPDWQKSIDQNNLDRQGYMAPVCWGQFLTKDLALSETNVCTAQEGPRGMETGWRIRQKIVDLGIKNMTFPGFQYTDQGQEMASYFGSLFYPMGLHMMKGTSIRDESGFSRTDYLIDRGLRYWR